jgi:formylglycine-generating enzyme required for sulfatase activity
MSQKKQKQMVVVLDDFSDMDQIGYDEYSEGLVEMIRSVGAKGEKGSFTIGIFGQWGQGKTSMLRQIEKKLNEIETTDKKEILTVWFNPWQFTGEEHIIIPFFHTLVSYLEEFKEKKGKSISQRFTDFLKELAHVPVALAYGMEGKIKIPLLLETTFKMKDVIDDARNKKEEIEKKSEPEMKKLVNKYESMYYRLISRLQAASNELDLKIVVFIDDLDRCLPEKSVELLEGLKVLLDLSGFVFVIAVAREVIEQGIRVRYKELYSNDAGSSTFLEQDYLDKIIQFPFALPPPDLDRLKSMVDNYLKDLAGAKPYLETIQKSLGTNPRSLKRCINNLSYTFWVAKRKGEFQPELLIKMTMIAFLFPGFYRIIGKTPVHLIRVQDIINKKRDEKEEEKPGVEDMMKESTGTGTRGSAATGFPEIDDLKLLERSNLERITEILLKQKREGVEEDLGFHPINEEEVRRYVSLLAIASTPKEPKVTETGDLWQTMESRMVQIPEGKVLLKDEKSGNKFTAEISPFFMDKFPVTQDLYEKVMGKEKNKSHFGGGDRPVETVSWFDAVEFCNRLSEKAGLKPVYTIDGEKITADWHAKGFRLPTEAEWEYACRAGTTGERYGEIDEIAWYAKNSKKSTQGVGKLKPNPWGLYDMLGNVWEWCWDWYGDYPKEDKKDWRGPESGSIRVLRGGSWGRFVWSCRAAYRRYALSADCGAGIGFRLARSL